MCIKKVTLHNFRGFRDGEIELKPLTVLLGPNSAGKSSFGHALAAMAHAHRVFSSTNDPRVSLTPAPETAHTWPIDLGSLNDLRTNGASGPVKVGIETGAGLIEIGFGIDASISLLPSYFRHPKGEESGGADVGSVRITTPLDAADAVQAASGTGPPKAFYRNTDYEVRRTSDLQWEEGGVRSIVILDGLLLRSVTHERGTSHLLSGKARDELEFLFNNLAYLQPSRRRPSRTFSRSSESSSVGYAGEWTASVLHQRGMETVKYAKLPSIPNTVEEAIGCLEHGIRQTSGSLLQSAAGWLQQLGLATSLKSEQSKSRPEQLEVLIAVPKQQERNLIEIGFGTSQVLPIITAGLLQPPKSLFIVDLPEAHLHPRPQADLADFFCSLALSDRFSLVETHSEMFFDRLRLRAEMDENLKQNIAVYFIDNPVDGICCKPRRVGLGLDEQFEWPVGFFQEAWEGQEQIEAVRKAKMQAKRK